MANPCAAGSSSCYIQYVRKPCRSAPSSLTPIPYNRDPATVSHVLFKGPQFTWRLQMGSLFVYRGVHSMGEDRIYIYIYYVCGHMHMAMILKGNHLTGGCGHESPPKGFPPKGPGFTDVHIYIYESLYKHICITYTHMYIYIYAYMYTCIHI